MRRIGIGFALSILVVPGAHAQDRYPFHVATFSDSRTISLAITSSVTPFDGQYDFEVDIGLTELSADGNIIFADHGAHAVRVRCEAPGAVKVGVIVHMMPRSLEPGDWMRDLWKVLCLQPTS
ncbi:hypothetical protein FB009_12021 [Sinorhizobium medicae]|uniref:hypothetical protein n=1 Tax=Rhizobiaceae TaxID=82115 RepID=UPI00119AF84F|nr:hypothetical protein [Sinorhizobium medicae]MQU73573.1 hypothetical protein [Sinorhizobium medicae]TWA33320.1 hypothetical protein FB009_12021 [Sinorhizobium medicae]